MTRRARACVAFFALATPALAAGGSAQVDPVVGPFATLIAAGDVASCRTRGDERTARLLGTIEGTVAVLGDTVYERGTPREFRRCYRPSWGRERRRTRPAVGNHEYRTRGAAGYFRYFGRRAGRPGKGWYSYALGTWHVVVLNTNCSQLGGCGPRSAQYRWLRADLAAHPARCTLAYGHHPRFSSGFQGPDRTIQPLWRLLAEHGAEVYLAGHDHHYERLARLDGEGRFDERGIRQFVVGTGGRSLFPVIFPIPASRARNDREFGVLVLDLLPGAYAWRFVPVAGGTYADVGDARCH